MGSKKLSKLQVDLIKRTLGFIEENNFKAGQHITEAMLVAEFNVSRSPVRAALQNLETRGILEAIPNQGFFLKRDATSITDRADNLPTSEEESLYVQIVKDRGQEKLDDAFTEADYIRRYNINRGTLVRTLQRLSHDGIVEREKGYGWRFSFPVHSKAVEKERYLFRMALEPAALVTETFHVDMKRLTASKQAHQEVLEEVARAEKKIVEGESAKVINIFAMNAEFHEMLVSFSNNRYFIDTMRHQNRIRAIDEFRHLNHPDLKRIQQSCREHIEILEALEKGDNEWASQLLLRHISIAAKV